MIIDYCHLSQVSKVFSKCRYIKRVNQVCPFFIVSNAAGMIDLVRVFNYFVLKFQESMADMLNWYKNKIKDCTNKSHVLVRALLEPFELSPMVNSNTLVVEATFSLPIRHSQSLLEYIVV